MIIFERTEKRDWSPGYDGFRLEVTGGYETSSTDWCRHLHGFLRTLGFPEDVILDGFRDYLEDFDEVK